ncbi:MAG: hypothetical protein V2A73_08195, partial [Pseudomonadota bacterium]
VGGDANIPNYQYFLPIPIPAGTRIAARCQCSTGGVTMWTRVTPMANGFLSGSSLGRVTTYGAATADSGGVSVDCGAAAWTKGAYSQIVAATTYPCKALLVAYGNQKNGTRTATGFGIDIAIGGAGSEKIVLPDLYCSCYGSGGLPPGSMIMPLPIAIPAGVRLAARGSCGTTDATDRLLDIVIYGID